MRRFEMVEDGHQKFWEVRIDGSELHVCYGRIGTGGKAQKKSFASPAAAQKEHDKLVREKTGKGYKEVTSAASKSAAAKPTAPKVVPPKSPPSSGKWRPRFEAMVAELRKNKKVEVDSSAIAPPATDAQIAAAEKWLGRSIDASVLAFYREMNGFDLEWTNQDSGDGNGSVHLRPIEDVFRDHEEDVGGDEFAGLLPFDVFASEACVAFDRSESPFTAHYHYFGEERSATNYSFEEYLERVLVSRGYFYWAQSLCEDRQDSIETQNFLADLTHVFRGADKRLFRPKGGPDLSTLSFEDLARTLRSKKEVSRDLAQELQQRGKPTDQLLERLLRDADPAERLRALRVLQHYAMKALPFIPLIVRVQVGLENISPSIDEELCHAAWQIFMVMNRASHNGLEKATIAGVKALGDETDIRPIALLLDAGSKDDVDPKAPFFAVALETLKRSDDEYTVEKAQSVIGALKAGDQAFELLIADLDGLRGPALARRVACLSELSTNDKKTTAAQKRIIKRYFEDPDENLQVAAVGGLWMLGASPKIFIDTLAHPSAKVQLAVINQLAAGYLSDAKVVKALAQVGGDTKRAAPVRKAAQVAMQDASAERA